MVLERIIELASFFYCSEDIDKNLSCDTSNIIVLDYNIFVFLLNYKIQCQSNVYFFADHYLQNTYFHYLLLY